MLARRKFQIAGAGIAVLTLAAGVFASVWPELIKPHPYWLGTVGLIGLILLVGPSILPPTTPEAAQTGNSITTMAPNHGNQIVAHGDVYVGQPTEPIALKKSGQEPPADPPPVTPPAAEKTLDLNLIPHGDNDTSAYLEVMNQGVTATIVASLRLVGLSTGNLYKTYPFDGEWKNKQTTSDFYSQGPDSYTGKVRIESNRSRLLKIAEIISIVGSAIQEMAICGIEGECIWWELDPRSNRELPYYVIQVTLTAEGYPKAVSAKYEIGPRSSNGPFKLTEIKG